MGALDRLRDLLFPPRCVFCRKILKDGLLCPDCRDKLPRCGRVITRGEFFSKCCAPLFYTGSVRDALLRYKFNGRRGYAALFAQLMAESVGEELAGEYDIVTWVPVSARRLHERGYDQAELLARSLAAILGAPVERLLKKSRHTNANSSLSGRAARAANILGAYEAIDRETVRGKRVLLIDDIFTTGATMSECARILLMAGAEDVVCCTVACAGEKNRKN